MPNLGGFALLRICGYLARGCRLLGEYWGWGDIPILKEDAGTTSITICRSPIMSSEIEKTWGDVAARRRAA